MNVNRCPFLAVPFRKFCRIEMNDTTLNTVISAL